MLIEFLPHCFHFVFYSIEALLKLKSAEVQEVGRQGFRDASRSVIG